MGREYREGRVGREYREGRVGREYREGGREREREEREREMVPGHDPILIPSKLVSITQAVRNI